MSHFNRIVFLFAGLTVICQQSLSSAEITKHATFQRLCHHDFDCNFQNTYNNEQVFLTCNEGKCQCKNPQLPILDAANYPVRYFEEQCFVSSKAPCGTTNGLTLVCETGRDCVDGRCRSKSEIRAQPVGAYCNEDIDCQDGLKCKLRLESFLPTSYCEQA